jgi:hypothetical protein
MTGAKGEKRMMKMVEAAAAGGGGESNERAHPQRT